MNIKISERDFETYLNLYKFPIDLEEALAIKHQKLQDEQIKISAKIRDHVRDTKCIIKAFRSRYKKFQVVGLATKAEIKESEAYMKSKDYFDELIRMGEKDGAGDIVWDPEHVRKWCDVM